MAEARYAQGRMQAVITDAGAALISADLPAATVARIWERLREGRGFPAVLEALTGAFGTSLTAIPPFAVVLFEEDAVRVAVRGDLMVEVHSAAGSELVTGAGVTTWSEQVIAAPGSMILRGRADEPAELPLRDGVVLASVVSLRLSDPQPADPQPADPQPADPQPAEPRPAQPGGAAHSEPADPQPTASVTVDVLATLVPTSTASSPPSAASGAPDELISAVPAALAAPAADAGYDHLWGATVIRSVEDAAVREQDDDAAEPEPSAPAPPEPGDHDGRTISVAEARALRQLPGQPPADAAPGASMPPLAAPRPPAPGRIRLSTGQVVLLDRTVVVGRRPRSTRVVGTDLPHLVGVESPRQDISRSHVELRVEGESIVAIDLHTTNGTTLIRAGDNPVQLHPGEPTVVVPGDVIDLGDGQSLRVEGLG